MSYRTLSPKTLNATVATLLKRSVNVGIGLGALTPILAAAGNPVLPSGGVVAAGTATIGAGKGNGLVVKQSSSSAIINWQQFNIGQGDYVQFLQPSSSSVILNRVIGGSPSSILGNLTANGQVFLVNTNGVYFGKTASLDAQGFLASTLDITDANFLAGDYLFDQPSSPGAQVNNQGHIQAHAGGYVVLAGDYANNSGIISAQAGHIILASGAKDTLTLSGNHLINFAVDQATLANYAGVRNTGRIIADGGTVIMTADVANALKATVVNNLGLIEATTLNKTGSAIYLTASGGDIENAGTLDAAAGRAGLAGGDITLKGDERTTLTDTSRIDAKGNGADGGYLEVSGDTVSVRGTLALGKGGHMLVDPSKVEITSGSSFAAGTGAGTNAGNNGSIGVKKIDKMLTSGASVTISAHSAIFHGSKVTAIKATGAGELKLKVNNGAGNGINLSGVDISIGGKLSASMGYGSFGHITAASVDLHATDDIKLAKAVVNKNGVVTTNSVKSTVGSLSIHAADIKYASASSSKATLAFSAKRDANIIANVGDSAGARLQGNLVVSGASYNFSQHTVFVTGKVTATASDGYAGFHVVNAQKGISITQSGNAELSASDVTASSGSVVINRKSTQNDSLNLNHNVTAGGNVIINNNDGFVRTGYIKAKGSITVNAGAHQYSIESSSASGVALAAKKSVSLTDEYVRFAPTKQLVIDAAAGNITVKGAIGGDTTEGPTNFSHGLALRATGTISLDHDIFETGDVDIQGGKLAYTGTQPNFSIEAAGNHDLIMSASIGSAKAPGKYNVNLLDYGGFLRINKSIYVGSTVGKTAAHIDATQVHAASGAAIQGVHVGNSSGAAVTLSAKGDINLKGENVVVGAVNVPASGSHTSFVLKAAAVNLIAGGNVDISAASNVNLHPSTASVGFGAENNSVLVQAGGNIVLKSAQSVRLQGGTALAYLQSSGKVVSVADTANLTLTAKGSIDISASGASGKVGISGGFAGASIARGKPAGTHTATAEANISITAGTSLTLSAQDINVSMGAGSVVADATTKAVVANVSAEADVSLKAGTALKLLGGAGPQQGVWVGTGQNANSINLLANGSHAAVNATLHTDLNIDAGGSIVASGNAVRFQGGGVFNAGSSHNPHTGFMSASNGDTATLTATQNMTVTAGAGGIKLQTLGHGSSNQHADAGFVYAVASGFFVAGTDKGKATANFTSGLTVTTTGDLDITADSFAGFHGSGGHSLGVLTLTGGTASLTDNGNVSITAKDVNITGGVAAISAGSGLGAVAHLSAKTGTATLNLSQNVAVTATGNIDLTAGGHNYSGSDYYIYLAGVGGAGYSAGVNAAQGGKAAATVSGNLSLTAGGNIGLSVIPVNSSRGSVGVFGGGGAGEHAGVKTGNGGGTATLNVSATTALSAKGSLNISVGSNGHFHGSAVIAGGNGAGSGAQVIAATAGGKANLTDAAGVTITTGTGMNVDAGSESFFAGGGGNAGEHIAVVGEHGGAANASINAAVSLTAGGAFTADAGHSVALRGGASAGVSADVIASHSAAKANLTVNTALNLKASAMTLHETHGESGSDVAITGGYRAAGSAYVVAVGAGDKAGLAVSAGATVNATKGSIAMHTAGSGSNYVILGGGNRAAEGADVGAANLTVNSGLTLTAKTGIKGTADGFGIEGGNSVASGAHVVANIAGGKANLTAAAGVTITTGTGITLTAGSGSISVAGGREAGNKIVVQGLDGGAANASIDAAVSLTAAGAFSANAGRSVTLRGGISDGYSAEALASHSAAKATLTVNTALNLKASAVTLHDIGSSRSDVAIIGGAMAAHDARAVAVGTGDVAGITVSAGATVTATKGSIAMLAQGSSKNNVVLLGGGGAGRGALVEAISGTAAANLTVNSGLTLTAKTGIKGTGDGFSIEGGSEAGSGMAVLAKVKGTKATVSVTAGVSFTAASIKMTGSGSGDGRVVGGSDMGADLHAAGSHSSALGGQVTANLNTSVNLKAAGSIDLNAGEELVVATTTGNYRSAAVFVGAGGAATVNFNGGVNLTAGTTLTLTADDLQVSGGSRVAGDGHLVAEGPGSKISFTDIANVNLTAATVDLTGHSTLYLFGGFGLASSLGVHAIKGGQVTANLDASLNIKATTGSLDVIGGSAVYVEAGHYGGGTTSASGHGAVAKVTTNDSVNLTAAKDLNISGSAVFVTGGGNEGAAVGGILVAGANGGSAAANLNVSANLKAGKALSIKATAAGAPSTARGDVILFGGAYRLNLNANGSSASRGPGKTAASFNGAVNVTAGSDVSLNANHDLIVDAGQGMQLMVGGRRNALGSSFANVPWAGGNDTAVGNAGVSVTAGKDLNLKAANDLNVQGMYGVPFILDSSSTARARNATVINQADVYGGSSHATAKLTLLGNALLTAKGNVNFSVGNNASILGGSMANIRVDHAMGKVTLLASADAIVHAGANVNLNSLGGNLTVAGVGVNASHAGRILADAHASQGVDSVTAHGDASLSAVGNIATASLHNLGGDLTVAGGVAVDAVAIGNGTTEHATATANATIAAGGNISIIGNGGLNVMAGAIGSAEVAGSTGNARLHVANQQVNAAITAGKTLTLSVQGDGQLIGGNTMSAKVHNLASASAFMYDMTGSANLSASATLKGATVNLTVGGNFLMHAGSGGASASESRGRVKAKATATMDATITATGAVNLTLGTTGTPSAAVNTASFSGGNALKATVFNFGSYDQGAATVHGDVSITAGSTLTVTANGKLKVAGGPGAESGAFVVNGISSGLAQTSFGLSNALKAYNGVATATVTGQATFTAGGNLTVSAAKGITILGGSHAGSLAHIQAVGSSDKTAVTVNNSVVMKAGGKGALSVTAASGGVNITTSLAGQSTGGFTSRAMVVGSGAATKASSKINVSVTLTGHTVSVTHTDHAPASPSFTSGSSKGSFLQSSNATINVGVNLPVNFAPRSLGPTVRIEGFGVQARSQTGAVNLGVPQTLSDLPSLNFTGPSLNVTPGVQAPVQTGALQLTSDITDLGTLQSQGLVMNLVTLVGAPAEQSSLPTAYTPDLSSLTAAFPAGCTALVLKDDGQRSCRAGGK